MKYCLCLFLCMGVRRRDLELGMDNLRGLLGIRKRDGALNARILKSCGVKEEVNERIGEDVLWWFGEDGE